MAWLLKSRSKWSVGLACAIGGCPSQRFHSGAQRAELSGSRTRLATPKEIIPVYLLVAPAAPAAAAPTGNSKFGKVCYSRSSDTPFTGRTEEPANPSSEAMKCFAPSYQNRMFLRFL